MTAQYAVEYISPCPHGTDVLWRSAGSLTSHATPLCPRYHDHHAGWAHLIDLLRGIL